MAENGNGKLPGFGYKETMTLLVFVFGIGGTWAGLNHRVNAQERDLEAVTSQSNADSKKIVEVQKDVESIKEDVSEIKDDLKTLLREIQSLPSHP